MVDEYIRMLSEVARLERVNSKLISENEALKEEIRNRRDEVATLTPGAYLVEHDGELSTPNKNYADAFSYGIFLEKSKEPPKLILTVEQWEVDA